MLRLAVALALVSCVAACNVAWPNGTETKTNWFQCGGDIKFYNATPQNKAGQYEYPIHLSYPLIIMTDAQNPTKTYDTPALKQTINVWAWAQTGNCAWSVVPTFGLLKNLDACTNGVNCPIKPGRQAISFELDFSDYGSIINLLTDNAPYQLQYILNDAAQGEAACITFQARAYIH